MGRVAEVVAHLGGDVKPWMLYAGAALLALLWWKHHEADLRDQGAAREREAALVERNAHLENDAGRIDTVYTVDTIRLVSRHTAYVASRDTLRITDTVQVRHLIALADSTISACSVALLTCEQAKANLRAQIANLDSTITAIQQQRPGFLRRTFGCTAGLAATTKGAGLGAACGVTLF